MELEMQGPERALGVRQDLPSAQWPALPYQGWGLIPSYWSRSPERWAWANSVPFKCVLFPTSQSTGTITPETGNAEASGAHVGSWLVLATDRVLMHCLWRPVLHSDAASKCKFSLSLLAGNCLQPRLPSLNEIAPQGRGSQETWES